MKKKGIDYDYDITDTFKAMIRDNSRKSDLYQIVLDILNISEATIQDCYFHSLSPDLLFDSLLDRDKSAILYLMNNFNSNYSFEDLKERSIGIADL